MVLTTHGIFRDIPIHSTDRAGQHFTLRLRIEPVGKDYRLVSLKAWKGDAALKAHEQDLLEGIFSEAKGSVLLSNLENTFYDTLPQLRDDVYRQLVGAGLLDQHPDRIRRLNDPSLFERGLPYALALASRRDGRGRSRGCIASRRRGMPDRGTRFRPAGLAAISRIPSPR